MSTTNEIVVIAGIAVAALVSANMMMGSFLKALTKVNDQLKEKIRTIKDAEQQLRHTLDRYEMIHRPVRTKDQKEVDKEYLARIDEQIKAERKREEERLIKAPHPNNRRSDHLSKAWDAEQDKKPGI